MNLLQFVRRTAAVLGLFIVRFGYGQAPTIVAEATPVNTYLGYPARLELSVTSPAETPRFQWYLLGVGALPGSFTNVSGATNAALVFTDLGINNSGSYFAIISNSTASVTSAFVNLLVLSPPLPALKLGELASTGDGFASLDVAYLSHGTETNLAFSVSFAGGVLTDPSFQTAAAETLPEPPAGILFGQASDAQLTTTVQTNSAAQVDGVGVSLELAGGRVFRAGERALGTLRWRLASERPAFEGRIVLTNVPTAAQARSITNGLLLNLILGNAPPMLLNRGATPVLNRQSGLYLQPIIIANPGATDLTNARLSVIELPVDSRTNQIRVYNALSQVGANATLDPGLLLAGTSHTLTLEYFVPDHHGWPSNEAGPILPQIFTSPGFAGTRVVPVGVVLADPLVSKIHRSSVPNAAFTGMLLDFPTKTNRTYYIQYSAQFDFSKTNQVRLVLPAIRGTGSTVQWIDNGPPKTESPNESNDRFYRILEVR